MLLEDDLTGGRMMPQHKIVFEPVTSVDTKRLEEENPGIYLSCAVTWAQARLKNYRKTDEKSIARSEDETVDMSQIFMNPDTELNLLPRQHHKWE